MTRTMAAAVNITVFTIDLISSTRFFRLKMRLKPLTGLIFSPLGLIGSVEKMKPFITATLVRMLTRMTITISGQNRHHRKLERTSRHLFDRLQKRHVVAVGG